MSDTRAPARPVLPPVYFLSALVLMPVLHLAMPIRQVLVSPVRYLGLVLIVPGFLLVLWAAGRFRGAGTTIKPFEAASVLVVDGPYRLTRNPMYLGMLIVLAGLAVILGSVSPLAVLPLFAAVIQQRFIRPEEAALERHFGAEFRVYRARVRRWV